MAPWKQTLVAALAVGALFLPGSATVSTATADGPIVIRYASLAPGGSSFGKVLKAWGRSVKKETEGRVEIRFYAGGSQGDERDFIRKVRAGQLDAAGVTTTGLGMLVRPILVLTAPGLLTEYEDLYRVRELLRERFEKLFREAGFELLAWGDGGYNRLFSVAPFAKPDDLKKMRPWGWKDDPVFSGYLATIGANPVRVGAPEVYPGLQTRMIDIVPASAITAIAFQWHTKLKYVAKQHLNILVGGSIIDAKKYGQLTDVDQRILKETAVRGAKANDKLVVRDDAKGYRAMLERGIDEIDLSANQAAWDAVAKETRQRLVGRVYSKSLLESVSALALKK
ncbi:MAG: TRAP transporter substrate-binding protein DctP [Myxococcales bacterium]|nr:MAG: TRAP transporter substrate-binding protein DctP [Myxococcales bacterium]